MKSGGSWTETPRRHCADEIERVVSIGVEKSLDVCRQQGQQLRSGHIGQVGGGAAHAEPFGALVEEELVFLDGSAYVIAELVACVSAFRSVQITSRITALGIVGERVGRIRGKAVEFPGIAVEVTRP